jgi:hypothetical protein
MEGFEDRVERERALGAVEEECPFSIFDELWFASLNDSSGARAARFSRAPLSSCNKTRMGYSHFS